MTMLKKYFPISPPNSSPKDLSGFKSGFDIVAIDIGFDFVFYGMFVITLD